MYEKCAVCGVYPNTDETSDICKLCKSKGKLIYTTLYNKAYLIDSKIVYIGKFTEEEMQYVANNI